MNMNASFRFLIIAAAAVLWLGAVATADEPVADGDGLGPSVAAPLPEAS